MNLPKALLSNDKAELRKFLNKIHKWAEEQGIFIRQSYLGSELNGFVYRSNYGTYLIIVNKNISLELQREVLLHEIEHILYDMPEKSYTIGLDMQHSPLEKKADLFSIQAMAALGG
ncbi:uncharacterized protein DUF955 [Orenia metallireducens]|jgi:Zn-dependent peptidase ImmA (M78 family)|uniref:IrrE N-terminal-like domain-containing protein n=1 Tax=Orenia metallireducens TaxID=1413210 RepID=A0A285I933_9FIRM|nr:ImmA/IrrE family metallo-endopeptidase [Orenia metallireducens]PRX21697.1 uncharacterized protein DUF955 [Orenia metallireducens]SNY44474.1 protein of unknown function [Orenia metallireducens]